MPHADNAGNGFSPASVLQSGLESWQNGAAVAAETVGSLLETVGGGLKTAFKKS
jgi:hypothetical protein